MTSSSILRSIQVTVAGGCIRRRSLWHEGGVVKVLALVEKDVRGVNVDFFHTDFLQSRKKHWKGESQLRKKVLITWNCGWALGINWWTTTKRYIHIHQRKRLELWKNKAALFVHLSHRNHFVSNQMLLVGGRSALSKNQPHDSSSTK